MRDSKGRLVLGLLLAVLAVFGAGTGGVYLASSAVEVIDGEQRHSTRTFARDVSAVLASLDVPVDADDRVEPDPDTPVHDGLQVVVTRATTVEVQVNGQAPQTVTAVVDTVADVLEEADLTSQLENGGRLDLSLDAPVAEGDRIELQLPVVVTIVADGDEQEVETAADTVAEALADAGVTVGQADLVDPPPDADLGHADVITVERVETVTDVVEVSIEPDEERHGTDDLPTGETRVATEGDAGLRQETYEVTLVDGEETDRTLVAQESVREATNRVVLVGTGPGPVEEAQQLLADLGYPVGPVDGVDGPQTRRALCAWRRLSGQEADRAGLQDGELEALRATDGLPPAGAPGRGATADRTCQALYYQDDGQWQHVYQASTGADGLPSPGDYRIERTREGWHTSTLYPAPEPNMYNTLYIRGAIAIHGSHSVPPHPASAGCVRVTPEAADQLFADLGVGDPVRVIGSY